VLLFKVSFFQNTEALLSATASHFKNMRYDEMKKKKQESKTTHTVECNASD